MKVLTIRALQSTYHSIKIVICSWFRSKREWFKWPQRTKLGNARSGDLGGHEMLPFLLLSFPERWPRKDNFEDTLKFRYDSFEKTDFILYRYTLGTFLLFSNACSFHWVMQNKTSCSVREYYQGECMEEQTVHRTKVPLVSAYQTFCLLKLITHSILNLSPQTLNQPGS